MSDYSDPGTILGYTHSARTATGKIYKLEQVSDPTGKYLKLMADGRRIRYSLKKTGAEL